MASNPLNNSKLGLAKSENMDGNPEGRLQKQILELQRKIDVERKVRSGAESMKQMLKDKTALSQMELSIEESKKRLDFLEGEMHKLVIKRDGSGSHPALNAHEPLHQEGTVDGSKKTSVNAAVQTTLATSSRSSSFSLLTNRSGSGFFNKLRGRERSLSNTNMSPNSALPPRTESLTSVERKTSLTNLDLSKASSTLTPEKVAVKLVELQNKLEIETRCKEGAEKLLQMQQLKPELTVADKNLRSQLERNLKISVGKISLLKVSLQRYQGMHVPGLADLSGLEENLALPSTGAEQDKEKNKRSVSGRLQIMIGSVQNLLGKKSAKNEVYVAVQIDNALQLRTRTKTKLEFNEVIDVHIDKANEVEIMVFDKNDGMLSILFFRLYDLREEFRQLRSSSGSDQNIAIQNVWEMEPAGQIQLAFKFAESQVPKDNSRLQRNIGVKRRKIYPVNGHKFVAQHFYQIMKCALCHDYLVGIVAYNCTSCNLLCHKKCHDKVITKCISRSDEVESLKHLRHDVPHRFEHTTSMVPTWCSHCGQMLPVGKKGLSRCTVCGINCHEKCEVYVPNLCGITMEEAIKFIAAAKAAEDSIRNKGAEMAKKEAAGQIESERRTSAIARSQGVSVQKSAARPPSLDDFTFIAVLGKGNFGKVMLAEEKSTRRLYAIKVLKKNFILQNDEVESTKAEKRVFMAVNRGSHPFLVGLHSCFQSDTRIYFVMEYINGGDLMLHIQKKQFSEKQARFYAAEVLLALEFFHKQDIVYRDLKLDNILLSHEGHIKIADYGLCKERMGQGATTNTFCGTPEFMAPEILLEQNYTRAVDWWAFGVLIYEMILGQAPFKGQDEEEIFESIIQDEPLYPVNMPRESVSIIQQLLNKNPKQRLGAGPRDAEDIKAHPFFKGINWDELYNLLIPPPFTPKITSDKDVSNFDQEFTRENPCLTPLQCDLDDHDQDHFKGFSYVADWNKDADQIARLTEKESGEIIPLDTHSHEKAVSNRSSGYSLEK